MQIKRVVITGMGAVSPFGSDVSALWNGLVENRCAITNLSAEERKNSPFKTAAKVPELDVKRIPREVRRAMSPMSIYACFAAFEALEQAGFNLSDIPKDIGICASSTIGSTLALEDFFREYITTGDIESVRSTVFFKVMSHTVASSISMACGLNSTLYSPAAACATGLMSIGMAYERIAFGKEKYMLCGGADEYHILTSATFDKLGAASHEENPLIASRPFSSKRKGLVIGEGAGIVLLESLESALERNATILAEVTGFSSICSSKSIAFPDSDAIALCMEKALESANLKTSEIDYVNAHATGTIEGDKAEIKGIAKVFDKDLCVSSLKGYMGHTLAASGALESIAAVRMLQENTLIPNYNLEDIDPACALVKLETKTQKHELKHILKNAFALGGVHASLVLSKWAQD